MAVDPHGIGSEAVGMGVDPGGIGSEPGKI
jgi:hypothetical protein